MIKNVLRAIIVSAVFVILPVVALSQIPSRVENELLAALDQVGKFGTYLGNYDDAKNAKANDDVRALLERHGKRKDILKYSFAKLKKEMSIETSRDGKFRIYSWDTSTGGTMHDFDCVFQFQGQSGKVDTWACSANPQEDVGSSYLNVFEVGSKAGTIYLANSRFIGDGQDHGQAIEAYKIVGDKLDKKPKVIKTARGLTNKIMFEYNPFTLEDRSEGDLVLYDSRTLSFRFPVVVEGENAGVGRVTDKFITYKFDGQYFVKVK